VHGMEGCESFEKFEKFESLCHLKDWIYIKEEKEHNCNFQNKALQWRGAATDVLFLAVTNFRWCFIIRAHDNNTSNYNNVLHSAMEEWKPPK